jgi:hypothetical protein
VKERGLVSCRESRGDALEGIPEHVIRAARIVDGEIALESPDLNEMGSPLFELRGIHPFHDFPEGPDWWNEDDYKAIISQLPKMRMNFFALILIRRRAQCRPPSGLVN